jgi:RNA polymerase-binding transcription factor DksA
MTDSAATTVHAALAEARAGVADLRRELAGIAESTDLVPDDEHDAEGSTIGFERARVGALLAQSQRRVADLDLAAARIGTGAYDRCERCGSDIGHERLEALPATRICVRCAGPERRGS